MQDERKLDHLITNLSKTFNLTDEGDAVAYLGVDVNRTIEDSKMQIKLTQPHLIQMIFDFFKLSDSRLHDMPAEPNKPLTRDCEGEHTIYSWSYCSLLGMLNYLCGTCPDFLQCINALGFVMIQDSVMEKHQRKD